MKRRNRNSSKPGDDLGGRIVADLLDLSEGGDIGETIARRIRHLTPEAGRVVIAQALGITVLTLQQVRQRSATGADVIREVRDGLTTDIVAGIWPPEGRS